MKREQKTDYVTEALSLATLILIVFFIIPLIIFNIISWINPAFYTTPI